MSNIILSKQSLVEGDPLTFSMNLTPAQNNQTLFWSISGTGITNSDFVGASLIGSARVMNAKYQVTVVTSKDFVTEGSESFVVKVYNLGATAATVAAGTASVMATSAPVTITDLSLTGTVLASVTSVVEGGSVTLELTTTNVQTNAVIPWKIVSSSMTAADFGLTSLFGTTKVTNNKATLNLKPAIDNVTEGNETFTVVFYPPSVSLAMVQAGNPTPLATSPTVTVTDLIRTVTITPLTTTVTEGQEVRFSIRATNYPNPGTVVLRWLIDSPSVSGADISQINLVNFNFNSTANPVIGTVKLDTSGTAGLRFMFRSDFISEGDETFVLKVFGPDVTEAQIRAGTATPVATSVPITVQDLVRTSVITTSVNPAYEGQLVKITYAGSSFATNLIDNAGKSIYPWKINSSTLTTADIISINGGPPTLIGSSVFSQIGFTIDILLRQDFVTEGDESFTISFYDPGTSLAQVTAGTATPIATSQPIVVKDFYWTGTVTPSVTQLAEGQEVLFNFTMNSSDSVPVTKQVVKWKLNLNSISMDDIESITINGFNNNGKMLGTIGINNNTGNAALRIKFAKDFFQSEGNETISVSIYGPNVADANILAGTATPLATSATVTVSDFVRQITAAASSLQITESDKVTVTMSTPQEDMPSNVYCIWKLNAGAGISPEDMVILAKTGNAEGIYNSQWSTGVAGTGRCLFLNGQTIFEISTVADFNENEGNETFSIDVYPPTATIAQIQAGTVTPWISSPTITIADLTRTITSTSPVTATENYNIPVSINFAVTSSKPANTMPALNTSCYYKINSSGGVTRSDFYAGGAFTFLQGPSAQVVGQLMIGAANFVWESASNTYKSTINLNFNADGVPEPDDTFTVSVYRPGTQLQDIVSGTASPWFTSNSIRIIDAG